MSVGRGVCCAVCVCCLVVMSCGVAVGQEGEGVERLRVEVVRTIPHARRGFTQGLVVHKGVLLEGTGLRGQSQLRALDRSSGRVLRARSLPSRWFGEGIAVLKDRAVQLTWEAGVALVWDLSTWDQVGTFRYSGQGWGLCSDGTRLVMSDGSDVLQIRDVETFRVVQRVRVRSSFGRLRLNALACVGGTVYANIWRLDKVARIDLATGALTGWIDATHLRRAWPVRVDVLNGIAYDQERDTFWMTGKDWPVVYEVRLISDGKVVQ